MSEKGRLRKFRRSALCMPEAGRLRSYDMQVRIAPNRTFVSMIRTPGAVGS